MEPTRYPTYTCQENGLQIKALTLPYLNELTLKYLERPWVIVKIPECKISDLKKTISENQNIFGAVQFVGINEDEYQIIGKPLKAIIESILENAPLAHRENQEKLKKGLEAIERHVNFKNISLKTVTKNGKEIPQLTFSLSKNFIGFLEKEGVKILQNINKNTAQDSDLESKLKTKSGYTQYTISGNQSVLAALKLILKYQQNWERNDQEILLQKREELEKARLKKITKAAESTTPTLTKKYSELTFTNNVKLGSYRTVKEVTVSGKPFIFKAQDVDRKGAQYQAAIALRNKILLGQQSALTYIVTNEKGERVGVVCEKLPNLVTFAEDYNKNPKGWKKKNGIVRRLVDAKLGAVLAVMHVHFEDDCHPQNIGFSKGLVVNFDDDRKLRQITSKYQGFDPTVKVHAHGRVLPAPQDAFPIHREDIIGNPELIKAQPDLQISDFLNSIDPNISTDLAKDPKFTRDKYKHYLKHILLDDKLEEKIAAAANFSKKNNHFTELMKKSKEEFVKELLNIPEFLELITSDEELEKEIINEFTDYNKYASKIPEIKDVQVDIDALKKRYASVKERAIQEKAKLPVAPSQTKIVEQPAIAPKIDAQKNGSSSVKSDLHKAAGVGIFATVGAFLGGVLGSLFPVVGTIIGASLGAAVGGVIGVVVSTTLLENDQEKSTSSNVTTNAQEKEKADPKNETSSTKSIIHNLGGSFKDGKQEEADVRTDVENTVKNTKDTAPTPHYNPAPNLATEDEQSSSSLSLST